MYKEQAAECLRQIGRMTAMACGFERPTVTQPTDTSNGHLDITVSVTKRRSHLLRIELINDLYTVSLFRVAHLRNPARIQLIREMITEGRYFDQMPETVYRMCNPIAQGMRWFEEFGITIDPGAQWGQS